MLFAFFKINFKILYRLYFKEYVVLDKKKFEINAPIILVSNHPNTLTDVVGVAQELNHPVFFLANIGLFATKFSNWLFSHLFCIPIERKTDTKDGKTDNTNSFKRSHQHLNNGGSIYIAAEGYSTMTRVKHHFKTGAARIALGASQDNNWQNCTKLFPVSVIYDKPNYFRSRMLIIPSAPIDCKDYKEEYTLDPQKTVKKITKLLQKRIYEKSIYFDNEEELALFDKWEEVYRAEIQEPFEIETQNLFKVRDTIQDGKIKKHDIEGLWSLLKSKNISYKDLVLSQSKTKSALYFVLYFPFFLFGSLFNVIPSALSIFIVRKLNLYVGYNTTAKMSIGWFLFSIYYIIQYFILKDYLGWEVSLILFMLSLPLGIIAFTYYKRYQDYMKGLKTKKILKRDEGFKQDLLNKRSTILSQLQSLTHN